MSDTKIRPLKCSNCNKVIDGKPIRSEPTRHACSPNSINWLAKKDDDKFYLFFCSTKCKLERDTEEFKFWAELDRNASDSECFEHDHWEIDSAKRKIRVGKCKITGEEVRVEPLQPGDNSGQPMACYKHFTLRKSYV